MGQVIPSGTGYPPRSFSVHLKMLNFAFAPKIFNSAELRDLAGGTLSPAVFHSTSFHSWFRVIWLTELLLEGRVDNCCWEAWQYNTSETDFITIFSISTVLVSKLEIIPVRLPHYCSNNAGDTGFRTLDKSWFFASLSWFVHFCLEFVLKQQDNFFVLIGQESLQ